MVNRNFSPVLFPRNPLGCPLTVGKLNVSFRAKTCRSLLTGQTLKITLLRITNISSLAFRTACTLLGDNTKRTRIHANVWSLYGGREGSIKMFFSSLY